MNEYYKEIYGNFINGNLKDARTQFRELGFDEKQDCFSELHLEIDDIQLIKFMGLIIMKSFNVVNFPNRD